jgi:hypothetical protein
MSKNLLLRLATKNDQAKFDVGEPLPFLNLNDFGGDYALSQSERVGHKK